MRQKNAALRGALLLMGVSLFSQILAFFYRVWLARLISAEAIGLYQLVIPAYAIVMSLCVSGFTVAVSRLTASYAALGRTRAIRQAVNTARAGYLVMVLTVSLIVIPLSDGISVTLLGDARCRLGLLLLLPCILLTGWENVHKNYFFGRKNVIPPSVSEVLEQTVRVASILGLLFFFSPAYEETQVGLIVLGMIISEVVSAALLTVLYRRDRRKWAEPAAGDIHEPDMLGTVRKIAVPVAAANLLTNLIGSANSIIIPGRLIASGVDSSTSDVAEAKPMKLYTQSTEANMTVLHVNGASGMKNWLAISGNFGQVVPIAVPDNDRTIAVSVRNMKHATIEVMEMPLIEINVMNAG